MKRWMIVVLMVLVISRTYAEKNYRNFTDMQGRTIRGRVISFDPAKAIVKFERDNRKIASVPIKIFCEADQTFIRDGELVRLFANESRFKISAKSEKKDNEERSGIDDNIDYTAEDNRYFITLDNRSGAAMTGLTLEYCIFYEQEYSTGDGLQCPAGVTVGKIDVGELKPKKTKTLTTETVITFKAELAADRHFISGAKNVQRGKVLGIWVRVHLKVPGQPKETREFCLPDSIRRKKTWKTSSVDVGMNED